MATKAALTTPLTSLLTTVASNNTTAAVTPNLSGKWKSSSVWKGVLLSVKIGCSLETILILIFNLALLFLIVSSPAMRKQMKYHLVLSMVCANLIVGIFSSPFTVDFAVRQDWAHGCYFNVIRVILTVYVQNFVSMWGVVSLVLHYIGRVLGYEGPAWLVRLPVWLQKAVPGLVVAAPWVFALVVQTSLMFLGLHPFAWVIWSVAYCPLMLQKWATILLAAFSYFVPAVLLIILVIALYVLPRRTADSDRLHRAEMGATLVSGKEEMEGAKVHVLAALLSVLLNGPEHVFFGARLHITASWEETLIWGEVVILLSELLPVLLAVLWLVMLSEVRARAADLAARLPGCAAWCPRHSAPPETSAGPVAFRDLREE